MTEHLFPLLEKFIDSDPSKCLEIRIVCFVCLFVFLSFCISSNDTMAIVDRLLARLDPKYYYYYALL